MRYEEPRHERQPLRCVGIDSMVAREHTVDPDHVCITPLSVGWQSCDRALAHGQLAGAANGLVVAHMLLLARAFECHGPPSHRRLVNSWVTQDCVRLKGRLRADFVLGCLCRN